MSGALHGWVLCLWCRLTQLALACVAFCSVGAAPPPPFSPADPCPFGTAKEAVPRGGHSGCGWGEPPPPAPCVTFRRLAVSLRGPGQSPVLPFACCIGSLCSDGRCGPCSCWCRFRVRGAQGLAHWGCAGWCGGRFTVFAAYSPPHSGRPPHASRHFRVRAAQHFHPSIGRPGGPPCASPPCWTVRGVQAPHHSVGRTCAWRAP